MMMSAAAMEECEREIGRVKDGYIQSQTYSDAMRREVYAEIIAMSVAEAINTAEMIAAADQEIALLTEAKQDSWEYWVQTREDSKEQYKQMEAAQKRMIELAKALLQEIKDGSYGGAPTERAPVVENATHPVFPTGTQVEALFERPYDNTRLIWTPCSIVCLRADGTFDCFHEVCACSALRVYACFFHYPLTCTYTINITHHHVKTTAHIHK